MLVKNKVNVISEEELFSLATEIYLNAKHYARLAKYSAEANDYIGYKDALRGFEAFRDLMQNQVFAEWNFTEELEDLEHADIPVFTIEDWIKDSGTVVFTDESTIDDDGEDVPF